MNLISIVFLADIVMLSISSIVLLRYGNLTHSHPATIYLFFHAFTFTIRLLGIVMGAPTLFSLWGPAFYPVTTAEIARATVMGDVALFVMTVAWLRGAINANRNTKVLYKKEHLQDLSIKHIWSIVIFTFPIGLFGLVTLSRLPGTEQGSSLYYQKFELSGWIQVTEAWAGLSLMALIYWYGFRWWLTIPMVGYLLIMSYQGYHRYRVIIPIILLVQIYLDRHHLKWPSTFAFGLVFSLIILFYPLKAIGHMAQAGASFSEIVSSSTDILLNATSGQADDQLFLDEFASAVTLIDNSDRYYYGSTYLPLITLPIPRAWWPDKPGLADYIGDFSTPWRPMKETGMIVTFLGEAYANFGYIGIIVIPYILAAMLSKMYFYSHNSDYLSLARFSYLILACNLLQVYRDGLSSIIVFTFVNMMPLTLIIMLHRFIPVRRTKYRESISFP